MPEQFQFGYPFSTVYKVLIFFCRRKVTKESKWQEIYQSIRIFIILCWILGLLYLLHIFCQTDFSGPIFGIQIFYKFSTGLTSIDEKQEKVMGSNPYIQLAVVGTDPAFQKCGYGSELLKPDLEIADSLGLPCYVVLKIFLS